MKKKEAQEMNEELNSILFMNVSELLALNNGGERLVKIRFQG